MTKEQKRLMLEMEDKVNKMKKLVDEINRLEDELELLDKCWFDSLEET